MTRLTAAERETTITMSDADDLAWVVTSQRPIARRLRHLAARHPGAVTIRRDERNRHGQPLVEARIPAVFVGIRPSRHEAFRTAMPHPTPRPEAAHVDSMPRGHDSGGRTA